MGYVYRCRSEQHMSRRVDRFETVMYDDVSLHSNYSNNW